MGRRALPIEVKKANATKRRHERDRARKKRARREAVEQQEREGRISITDVPVGCSTVAQGHYSLSRDRNYAPEQRQRFEQTPQVEKELKNKQSLKSKQVAETRFRNKRERHNVPERKLAPKQTAIPQPNITATANDVRIISSWVVEDLGGGCLLVQCAAGKNDLVESHQPIIYVIKRNPPIVFDDQD